MMHSIKVASEEHNIDLLILRNGYAVGEIDSMSFIAQTARESEDERCIPGSQIRQLQVSDCSGKTVVLAAYFQDGRWVIKPDSKHKTTVAILVAFLSFNPLALNGLAKSQE